MSKMTFTIKIIWIKHLEVFFFCLFWYRKSSAFSALVFLARVFTSFFILASIFTFVNLLNSWVSLKWLVSGILFSISVTFAFRSALVARLVLSDILFSISVIFVFRSVFLTSVLRLGILLSKALTFVTNWSYTSFLTTSLPTALLSLLK